MKKWIKIPLIFLAVIVVCYLTVAIFAFTPLGQDWIVKRLPVVEHCPPYPGGDCAAFFATETAKAPTPPAWWPFGP